jgi:hypothetical protein
MAIQLIDTDTTDLLYSEEIQLEGLTYTFRFLWSVRESAWYLDISDQGGNMLAPWVRLVIGVPLLRRFVDPRLPPGMLFCADLTGMDRDIEVPSDLGTRVPLSYLTSDDVLLGGTG